MTTTTAASTRPTARRLLLAIALAAALAGFVLGRVSPGGAPAGATVDAWHTPTFTDPAFSEGSPAPAGYGIDGEGFVHLRGLVFASEVVIERSDTTSGPWQAHAFTMPCGFRPETRLLVEVGVYDEQATVGYEGLLQINDDGTVMLGALDIPTVRDGGDDTASFFTFLDSVTYQAQPDGPECVDEEPTTTTTTDPEATTTTTTEPEE